MVYDPTTGALYDSSPFWPIAVIVLIIIVATLWFNSKD
jgi:hypothetical protein